MKDSKIVLAVRRERRLETFDGTCFQQSNVMAVQIVVMGVCGCGKSTVGKAIAEKLNCDFQDADVYHSKENKHKMSNGVPLTDQDRLPWLLGLHEILLKWHDKNVAGVLACSALKKSYRDILRSGDNRNFSYSNLNQIGNRVLFIVLNGEKSVLAERMSNRKNHFMSSTLLDSQLETLEIPDFSELSVIFEIKMSPVDIADKVSAYLKESEGFKS